MRERMKDERWKRCVFRFSVSTCLPVYVFTLRQVKTSRWYWTGGLGIGKCPSEQSGSTLLRHVFPQRFDRRGQ